MADGGTCTDIQLLKRTKISVFVDDALPDILVVTYEFGVKIFKGVLLESTKKNLPCGVQTLNPAFNVTKPDDDPLYAVNQRFAYTDPSNVKRKNVPISKCKSNKMTVRLRPRQVLCSKCKGICNENSENVTRKRKISENIQSPPLKRSANAPITRSVYKTVGEKLPALDENIVSKNDKKPLTTMCNKVHSTNAELNDNLHSFEHSDQSSINQEELRGRSKKFPRKKRSAGSMEDLWDENVFVDSSKNNNNADQPLHTNTNTRTIKISYGPQGEGTVLKIPAQIESLNVTDDDDSEENDDLKKPNENHRDKATKKALKKAKKEAKKKVLLGSPSYSVGASSPRYTVGSASPRHGLGNASPRYIVNPTVEMNAPKKRKHKMKHKKKHKEDRKHREEETPQEDLPNKEQFVTQKLSINLKRLNNTYTSCSSSVENDDSGSEDISDQVPNFPPLNSPFVLRLNAQTVPSAVGANGCRLLVGDVVWGKIHGFPWWPGKVLTISNVDNGGPQAHVSWYGSPTSSLIQCDQLSPYLENFKVRYNKKKRGPYKEAIKQASSDAKENAENRLKKAEVVGGSPARPFISVVPPALASPREIDVVS